MGIQSFPAAVLALAPSTPLPSAYREVMSPPRAESMDRLMPFLSSAQGRGYGCLQSSNLGEH